MAEGLMEKTCSHLTNKIQIWEASLQKGPDVAKKIEIFVDLIEQFMIICLKKNSILAQIFAKLWSIYKLFQLPSQIALIEKFDVKVYLQEYKIKLNY